MVFHLITRSISVDNSDTEWRYILLELHNNGNGVCLQGLTLSSEAKDLEYLLSDIGIPAPPVLKSEDFTMVNIL